MSASSNIVLAALVIGTIAAVYLLSGSSTEGFWNLPARTWKVERVLEVPTQDGPDFFQTPGFQGILSPRFSNVNYGPNLRTQLPDYAMTGVPADPLGGDFGGSFYARNSGPHYGVGGCNATVVEGFRPEVLARQYEQVRFRPGEIDVFRPEIALRPRFDELDVVRPLGGGYGAMNVPGTNLEFEAERVLFDPRNPSAYANGDYKRVLGALIKPDFVSDDQYGAGRGGEFGSYLTADGELKQPIVYDRFLYANRHSRLRSQGDWFRGDLPIVPNSGNWFVPSVHPNIDLNAGAINVMAGVNNETNHQLASLIYNSSGGGDTTIGGVDLEPVGQVSAFSRMNMGNRNYETTMSAGGDVVVTSFP